MKTIFTYFFPICLILFSACNSEFKSENNYSHKSDKEIKLDEVKEFSENNKTETFPKSNNTESNITSTSVLNSTNHNSI
jgi:hypothetical protein